MSRQRYGNINSPAHPGASHPQLPPTQHELNTHRDTGLKQPDIKDTIDKKEAMNCGLSQDDK